MGTYEVVARNYSEASENKIHSQEIARNYGFSSGLVPGVAVFGHMTYPMAEKFGEAWFEGYEVELRLLQPVYSGDVLYIEHTRNGDGYDVSCTARNGTLIARMNSRRSTESIDPIATAPSGPAASARERIHWDSIDIGNALPSWNWQTTEAENDAYTTEISDRLPIYQAGLVHPHAILSVSNQALSRHFDMPAWLHVGSKIQFRIPIQVGSELKIRSVPTEKWRNKGHEFVNLNVSYTFQDKVAVEVLHTAIYKIRSTSETTQS